MPFDVGCARCGNDLRGLNEPTCPACGLEFDWVDAVPIEQLTCLHCGYHLYGLRETRCPECGERFTWEKVLDDYRRRQKPLFEYRWREKPVRSLVRTWFCALRPGKFWRTIDIHDPPQVTPLIGIVSAVLVLFAVGGAVLEGVSSWLHWTLLWNTRTVVGGPPGVLQLPELILESLLQPFAYQRALFAVFWCVASFAALMIFRQSMRLCKVRAVHVLRVWAYAVPLMLPFALLLGFFAVWSVSLTGVLDTTEVLILSVVAGFLAHVTWSLRQGYCRYLRMRHSLGVAIASQIIALLTTAIFFGFWSLSRTW